jgi:hypothetical protein
VGEISLSLLLDLEPAETLPSASALNPFDGPNPSQDALRHWCQQAADIVRDDQRRVFEHPS